MTMLRIWLVIAAAISFLIALIQELAETSFGRLGPTVFVVLGLLLWCLSAVTLPGRRA